jgi:anti-anti-sigma factor
MEINTKKHNDSIIVKITGRLDAITATDFEESICNLIHDGERKFVFDFSEMDFISSAGLRAILISAKNINGENGALAFACISGMINEVFEISGFSTMFKTYESPLIAAESI